MLWACCTIVVVACNQLPADVGVLLLTSKTEKVVTLPKAALTLDLPAEPLEVAGVQPAAALELVPLAMVEACFVSICTAGLSHTVASTVRPYNKVG